MASQSAQIAFEVRVSRLVSVFLMEHAEDWSVHSAYRNEESIRTPLPEAA